MTAPITPDERAAMRERHTASRGAVQRGVASLTDVPRLLDALDTAEAEVARLTSPARPDRETVARALRSFLPLTPEPALDSTAAAQADAVLALWPGRSEATVKAEALRDAAGILQASYDRDLAYLGSTNEADWLRALADRIAAEGGADRG